jgi:hypothetical protein
LGYEILKEGREKGKYERKKKKKKDKGKLMVMGGFNAKQ